MARELYNVATGNTIYQKSLGYSQINVSNDKIRGVNITFISVNITFNGTLLFSINSSCQN